MRFIDGITWTWETNSTLKYITIIQTLSLVVGAFVVLFEKKNSKIVLVMFFLALGASAGLMYFKNIFF